MSQLVRPKLDGWVGYGDGASILLETGTPITSDHAVVRERPELFEPVDPPAKAAAKKTAKPSPDE